MSAQQDVGAASYEDVGAASYEDDSYTSYGYAHHQKDSYSYDSECAADYLADGECDHVCNVAAHNFDEGDCYHADPGCYVLPTGGDYRGSINVTTSGKLCQFWDRQHPHVHTYIAAHYPDSNLGGHRSCRNPSPEDGSSSPWCLVNSRDPEDPIWEYCDVGPPSKECHAPNPLKPNTHTSLLLGSWHAASVYEHRYDYYNVTLPAGLKGFQVVVVPVSGEPVLYVSFDRRFPTGHDAAYKQDDDGAEVFYMTSSTYGYCAREAVASEEAGHQAMVQWLHDHSGYNASLPTVANRSEAVVEGGGCALFLSVSAHETSSYHIVVYDTAGSTACAAGCGWKQLGNGECDAQCHNEQCFDDVGDCKAESASGTSQCHAACKPEWIGDGMCDDACFNSRCEWDGDDCGGRGCADSCHRKRRGNGVCDAACNVEACRWDGGDCYHEHGECYTEADGRDYLGTVSHTSSGRVCQRWSDQSPNVHTFTQAHYPKSGLGGHNFCRNPDQSQPQPWCYTSSPTDPRFELCDVGQPSVAPCPPPAPPPPRMPRSSRRAHPPSQPDGLIGNAMANLVVPTNASRGATLEIGVLIGCGLAAIAVVGVVLALWRLRGRMAKKGMYTFGAPPSAEAEEEDERM